MAAGLPDPVDCMRLAEESSEVRRAYPLGELPRLKDMLAERDGILTASFVFSKLPSGRAGAAVKIDALPMLVCQRCMQAFASRVDGGSKLEFVPAEALPTDAERESVVMVNGRVSLRDLAEEELLLALPMAPACSTPLTCGKAPRYETGADEPATSGETRRPLAALQDLLKKTR